MKFFTAAFVEMASKKDASRFVERMEKFHYYLSVKKSNG